MAREIHGFRSGPRWICCESMRRGPPELSRPPYRGSRSPHDAFGNARGPNRFLEFRAARPRISSVLFIARILAHCARNRPPMTDRSAGHASAGPAAFRTSCCGSASRAPAASSDAPRRGRGAGARALKRAPHARPLCGRPGSRHQRAPAAPGRCGSTMECRPAACAPCRARAARCRVRHRCGAGAAPPRCARC